MSSNSENPMQYVASYAVVFTLGVLAANLLRWYGQYMREAGRRDATAE